MSALLDLPAAKESYFPVAAPHYPPSYAGLPEPLELPWSLKPVSSADSEIVEQPDGRTRFWIRHDLLKGVTPRMLAWWFSHLEGDVEIHGRTLDRYRVWHPFDHVHVSYAWRRPDGLVGPGAAIRIREVLGRNRRHPVNITSRIEKLDETGFIHNPALHVASSTTSRRSARSRSSFPTCTIARRDCAGE